MGCRFKSAIIHAHAQLQHTIMTLFTINVFILRIPLAPIYITNAFSPPFFLLFMVIVMLVYT